PRQRLFEGRFGSMDSRPVRRFAYPKDLHPTVCQAPVRGTNRPRLFGTAHTWLWWRKLVSMGKAARADFLPKPRCASKSGGPRFEVRGCLAARWWQSCRLIAWLVAAIRRP